MSREYLLLVILASLATSALQQSVADNEVDVEDGGADGSPLADIAAAILKEQNVQNIGASLLQGLLQTNTAKALGTINSKLGEMSSEDVMEGLVGAWMQNQQAKKEGKQGEFDKLFKNIGNIMKKIKPSEGSDGSKEGGIDMGTVLQGLQGLGSMLGQQGGANANILGTLVNAFTQMQDQGSEPKKGKKKVDTRSMDKQGSDEDEGLDVGALLNLVGSFVGQGEGGDGGGFLKFLPMIQQTLNAFTGSEARKREDSHSDHSNLLPPVLERIHIAFDHFIHSDMGKHMISSVGAEKAFDYFRDEKGTFDYQKFNEMMENKSFRRHWIRIAVDRLIGFLQYLTQPHVYKQYFGTGQLLANSYLKSQGYPKSALFDPKRPAETISSLIDYTAKKYFDLKIHSKENVKPAIQYIQELLRLVEKKGPLGDEYKELGIKLADTLNVEIIEPLARVNRAYKYAKSVPKCTRYLMCLVNDDENNNEVESLPGLKKYLNKGASLVAGWYLTSNTDISFWSLYGDIIDPPNCKALYRQECDGFHEEELRVTTEYVHIEL